MRTKAGLISILVAAMLSAGAIAGYTADSPVKGEVQLQQGNILNVGDQAQFTLSGEGDVKKLVCVGETIPVYREEFVFQTMSRTEVGKVKVLAYGDANTFKAQVVEGQLKNGDMALKDSAKCLISPSA